MISNLKDLEQFVALEEGQTLEDLFKSEESHEIKFKEGKFYTEDEDYQRLGNYKSEYEKAGREKLLKEMRDSAGLEYEGVKDPENFINAISESVKSKTLEEANIEPSKKIKSLESDLDALRGQLGEKEGMINELQNKYSTEKKQMTINSAFYSMVQDKKTIVPKDDLFLLLKSKYQFDVNDSGGISVMKNGEELKDDLRNPVPFEKVVDDFMGGYLEKASGGAGKPDDTRVQEGTMEAFLKEMETNGVNAGSEKFNLEMQKRIQEGTLNM